MSATAQGLLALLLAGGACQGPQAGAADLSVQVEFQGASREVVWLGFQAGGETLRAVRFDRYRQTLQQFAERPAPADLPSPEKLEKAFEGASCDSISLQADDRFTVRIQRGSESVAYCTGESTRAPPELAALLTSLHNAAEQALRDSASGSVACLRAEPLTESRERMIRDAGQLPIHKLEDFSPPLQRSLQAAARAPYFFVPLEAESDSLPAESVLSIEDKAFQVQQFRSPKD